MSIVRRIMTYQIAKRFLIPVNHTNITQKKFFWHWLTYVFNRVDTKRVNEIGPDRACAEWLLRNGAFVKWSGASAYTTDYNVLSTASSSSYIQAVNATDSSISHIGFSYFKGCKYIKDLRLIDCKYIEDKALPLLSILKDTLTILEINNCQSITDEGLRNLKNLKNLKVLKISGLSYIKDKDAVKKQLTEALPNCTIDFK